MKMRMNYRNHRKIIVVDGLTGFVGGINVGDEYIGKHPRLGFWRDTHLRLEGNLNAGTNHDCLSIRRWRYSEYELGLNRPVINADLDVNLLYRKV
jgi:phosphatidylserine/phosphatidylglycerophosphate/cardiolipin synthase-like enzyme